VDFLNFFFPSVILSNFDFFPLEKMLPSLFYIMKLKKNTPMWRVDDESLSLFKRGKSFSSLHWMGRLEYET
jgi:hypothetical protein